MSRNYIIPRPHNLPSFLGDSIAPRPYQTLISLPIYMGNGTVALCKTDLVSWAQTLMPLHPVEAHFHTPLEWAHVTSEVSQGSEETKRTRTMRDG